MVSPKFWKAVLGVVLEVLGMLLAEVLFDRDGKQGGDDWPGA